EQWTVDRVLGDRPELTAITALANVYRRNQLPTTHCSLPTNNAIIAGKTAFWGRPRMRAAQI
ncbi:MAG: hypothetical protein LBC77_00410, partial [Spirochaetaceae bacterium]|nr:hypothetical protein [Spirochaetaceae bacterium]